MKKFTSVDLYNAAIKAMDADSIAEEFEESHGTSDTPEMYALLCAGILRMREELDEILAICEDRDPFPLASHGTGTVEKPAARAVRKLFLSNRVYRFQMRVIAESNPADQTTPSGGRLNPVVGQSNLTEEIK